MLASLEIELLSRFAELLIVAIVPLLVSLFAPPLDISADDELGVAESNSAEIDTEAKVAGEASGNRIDMDA